MQQEIGAPVPAVGVAPGVARAALIERLQVAAA
jgi:hypothetical protein